MAGADNAQGPSALIRGGTFGNGAAAGVFAVDGRFSLAHGDAVGFRAAR
jgi:hypothetical protein